MLLRVRSDVMCNLYFLSSYFQKYQMYWNRRNKEIIGKDLNSNSINEKLGGYIEDRLPFLDSFHSPKTCCST
jgi:hypothetical protein